MVWWPVSRAESAMMMDDEKLTGALGPDGALGTIDWRLLLDDIVDVVGVVIRVGLLVIAVKE